MVDSKELFLDQNLKSGGFYELSIQVCPSTVNEPIKKYTNYIWGLDNVEGPYDLEFNRIIADITNFEHSGILHLEDYSIPFRTYNIREDEPIESGFNWFDIYFYTEAIEKIFGEEYKTWVENPKCPKQITDFFLENMKVLYRLFPFQLAIIDFEVSGMYYLESLKTDLKGEELSPKFFVGRENYKFIADKNKAFVTVID